MKNTNSLLGRSLYLQKKSDMCALLVRSILWENDNFCKVKSLHHQIGEGLTSSLPYSNLLRKFVHSVCNRMPIYGNGPKWRIRSQKKTTFWWMKFSLAVIWYCCDSDLLFLWNDATACLVKESWRKSLLKSVRCVYAVLPAICEILPKYNPLCYQLFAKKIYQWKPRPVACFRFTF